MYAAFHASFEFLPSVTAKTAGAATPTSKNSATQRVLFAMVSPLPSLELYWCGGDNEAAAVRAVWLISGRCPELVNDGGAATCRTGRREIRRKGTSGRQRASLVFEAMQIAGRAPCLLPCSIPRVCTWHSDSSDAYQDSSGGCRCGGRSLLQPPPVDGAVGTGQRGRSCACAVATNGSTAHLKLMRVNYVLGV
jgi:hypothetical protein